MTFPTEPSTTMSAERVLPNDVDTVYRAIEAVDRWSSWIEGVVAPVTKIDDTTFELTRVHNGAMTTHRVVITARGPVHSLTTEVDGAYRLDFRTRPHPSGTSLEVCAEPLDAGGWWARRTNRRRGARAGAQLETLIDGLAAHLARQD